MKKLLACIAIFVSIVCTAQQQEFYQPDSSYLYRGDYTAQWVFQMRDSISGKSTYFKIHATQFQVTRLGTAYRAGSPSSLVWANDSGEVFAAPVGTSGQILKSTGTNLTWATPKLQETFSGATDSLGIYTVTFGTAYSVAPNIQANIIGGSNTNLLKITSITTTGFTVTVVNRVDQVGQLPSYAVVNGALVDVLITEK